MTNREINLEMKKETSLERKGTLRILNLINLAEKQKTHLELGYGNLHAWLIEEHKYSERSANRRIQAARLLKAVPEAKTKLEDGRVNLSTMARAQSMIRTQEKVGKVSREEKAKAIETIENQSELKAEQSLMSLFPENASQVNRERVTVINENVQRLALNHTNEAMADLQRIKELLSHIIPGGETAEVLAYLYKDFIKRNDPLAKKAATKNTATPNTNATGAPLARRASRKVVIQEADGCCSFRDPVTGRRCGNRVRVEQDHVIPRANGGDDSIQNARLLCRAHNQYMSETILGRERANRWRTRQDFR